MTFKVISIYPSWKVLEASSNQRIHLQQLTNLCEIKFGTKLMDVVLSVRLTTNAFLVDVHLYLKEICFSPIFDLFTSNILVHVFDRVFQFRRFND